LKAEIITIGDEILIGQIIDTNSAWMGAKLNEIGWEISRIHSIPDTSADIIDTLRTACLRSKAVLITGGLGPTKDDVTKTALCDFFQCGSSFHLPTFEYISRIFQTLNKPLQESHRYQAMLPDDCEPLHNEYGTAPGMLFKKDGCVVISMPGVPYEMKGIMESSVIPLLSEMSSEAIYYQTIVTANVAESAISEMLSDFESTLPSHIKLAYLPHYNFVRLRLTGRGGNRDNLKSEIDKQVSGIKAILGQIVITLQDMRIEEIVGQKLAKLEKTVSFAESCTGGYVAHLMTSIPGSSAYFPGSVVTYSYDNKTEMLGVNAEILWSEGAVSKEVATQMCQSVRIKNGTDYALALSGIAGPTGGTVQKPVGTVWIAVCDATSTYTKLYHLKGNRIQNIERTANLGLEMLRKLIVGELKDGENKD
jgi:competence/damage-inducible protein CinA-like protein